jgi:hypothetical protein
MKMQNMLFLLAVAGIAYLLFKKQSENSAPAPLVPLIEETLHKHTGEDTPVVHAFEEALEQKNAHQKNAPA